MVHEAAESGAVDSERVAGGDGTDALGCTPLRAEKDPHTDDGQDKQFVKWTFRLHKAFVDKISGKFSFNLLEKCCFLGMFLNFRGGIGLGNYGEKPYICLIWHVSFGNYDTKDFFYLLYGRVVFVLCLLWRRSAKRNCSRRDYSGI